MTSIYCEVMRMKTPLDFYNEYKGKTVDYDHAYGPQCVDGFKCFCSWAGLPVRSTVNGWADGYWIFKNQLGFGKSFEFIYETKDFRMGDWVIWKQKSRSHPKSHISMYFFLDGDKYPREFGESGSAPRGFTLKKTDFSDAIGALRWKEWAYVDVFRLYNRRGFHHFTPSEPEKNALVKMGWKYEGVAWQAPKSGAPVYSLYNRNNGDHLLTANKDERDKLVRLGLTMEGIKFYSGGNFPIYRLYNHNSGEHFYTANKGEYDALILRGWTGEKEAFRAMKGEGKK